MQLLVVLYCSRGLALRRCSFFSYPTVGKTTDALDETALLQSDSLASRCELSPYITASGTGRHLFFCQALNIISDFVYRLLSLSSDIMQSAPDLRYLVPHKLKNHQLASGQITLPEYFQCSRSPCIQVYSCLTMRGDTALCKTHWESLGRTCHVV